MFPESIRKLTREWMIMKPIPKKKKKKLETLAGHLGCFFLRSICQAQRNDWEARTLSSIFVTLRPLSGQSLQTKKEAPWYIVWAPQIICDSIQIISVLASSKHKFSWETDNLMTGLTLFLPLFICSDHAQSEISRHPRRQDKRLQNERNKRKADPERIWIMQFSQRLFKGCT